MSKKAALRSTIPNRVAAYVDLCIADLAAACTDTRIDLLQRRVDALEAALQAAEQRLNELPDFGPRLTQRQLRDLLATPGIRELNSTGDDRIREMNSSGN